VMNTLDLRTDVEIAPTPNTFVSLDMKISPSGITIMMPLILRNERADNPQTTPIRLDASNPPVVLSRVELEYPPDAKWAEISGNAKMEVVVNEKGEVYEANLLACHPWFQKTALEAVVQWKFQPMLVNGEPKPFITTVYLNFKH